MKKVLLTVMTVCLVILLTGCGEQNKLTKIDMDGMIDYMGKYLTFDDQLSELPQDTITWRYGVDEDVEARVFIGSGATSEEYGIFKATDEKKAKLVYETMEEHLEDMRDSFAMYLPKETKKIDNSYLSLQGVYVIFAVSADDNTNEIMENY